MNIDQALALIHEEHDSDDGLLLLFRLSDDAPEERLDRLLEALDLIADHYHGKPVMERDLTYKLVSLRSTLSASAGHWKVGRPAGMTIQRTTAIIVGIHNIFITE